MVAELGLQSEFGLDGLRSAPCMAATAAMPSPGGRLRAFQAPKPEPSAGSLAAARRAAWSSLGW